MGKTRDTANLTSDNNIFSDITNDRVGIGTTNTRFTLEVGRIGASGTSLHVNGNARVTGILSIGQGTVSIDGNTNQVNIGTGVTIHETNGIQVGQNIFHSSGLTLNSLNVTGVVTATGGVSIGIQSAGSNITTGIVTALNFVGTGNSISYNAGTKTVSISIAGGGGGSSTPRIYSDVTVGNESGWSAASIYSSCARTAGGKKGNTFFFTRLEVSSSQTRMRVYPFTVNRTTGVITYGTAVNVWLNTNGAGYSTTYFTGPDGTGAIFAGGHNMIPGYSSYVFSYSKFIVNANGTLTDNTAVYTNADHGYNGTYYTLPTAINTGVFPSAGYNAGDGSRAYYRQHTMNGSSISVGSLQSFSSDTSTSFGVGMIAQPGVFQSVGQVVGFIYFRTNSSNYRVRALAANGSFTDHAVSNWDSQAYAFQMTNGDVILYSANHVIMRFTAHNSKTDLTTANPLPASYGQFSFNHFGLGNNEFVLGLNSNSPFAYNFPLVKGTLNSTTGFSISGVTNTFSPLVSLGVESSYSGMFPLYANANDANPDKLLIARHDSGYIRTKVIDFPTFISVA
jgi:hypothetical protein